MSQESIDYINTILLNENKVIDWVKNKIKGLFNKGNKSQISIGRGSIKKGHILVYSYVSKLYDEDKLMFYDRYPLTIVTSVQGQYFWGFNLHYVPLTTKKRLIRFLKNQYPNEFNIPNYLGPLPSFSYDKIKSEFPYIADAMIKNYIKGNASGLTLISLQELVNLAKIDTSDFIFRHDSVITSVEQLHANWRRANPLQTTRNVVDRVV